MLVEPAGVMPLERPPDRGVQRAPLVLEQAVVGHFLRQHVLEAIVGSGTTASAA